MTKNPGQWQDKVSGECEFLCVFLFDQEARVVNEFFQKKGFRKDHFQANFEI